MSSKIGGGGEIVVLTIDHFNLFVHGWRFGSFICSKNAHQAILAYRLVFSRCQKVADLAFEELGMMGSEDEDKRGEYADDVVERTRNEEEASISLH